MGRIFFRHLLPPLAFAKSCFFFVPKIIFLRIWRQWRSVVRTLEWQDFSLYKSGWDHISNTCTKFWSLPPYFSTVGIAKDASLRASQDIPTRENDVLECHNCKNWVHRNCVQMSASAFQVWAFNSRTFLCKKCCFIGDKYDAEAGLERYFIVYYSFI